MGDYWERTSSSGPLKARHWGESGLVDGYTVVSWPCDWLVSELWGSRLLGLVVVDVGVDVDRQRRQEFMLGLRCAFVEQSAG